jgi:phospholipid N-methyltransferase
MGVNNKSHPKLNRLSQKHPLTFFRGFLSHPECVGSVVPSSRFLERRLVEAAGIRQARLVVELGPGTGGTTRAILDALPRDASLLAIEINPDFIVTLKSDNDPRLIIRRSDAADIREILAAHHLPAPDAVVSGIPFSTMTRERGRGILRAVWSCLAPGGRFVAYQVRATVAMLDRPLLGDPRVEVELRNVPPLRVFRWRKPDG